jgi:hypothetical protein
MHTHIYTMHKKRLRWNSHVSPPKPKLGKRGMIWVEIKVLQKNMMNNIKCHRELEWAPAWGRIDGIHHYNYRKATSNQHCLSSHILDMDSGGIQVDLMMVGSKFGRWQGAQFLEWSRIVCPSTPCNSNTPKGMIALILKVVRPKEVSRVSLGCC